MLKFLLIVFALSWPLQFLGYPHASMLAVALGTLITVHIEGDFYPSFTYNGKRYVLMVVGFIIVVYAPAFWASSAFRVFLSSRGVLSLLSTVVLQVLLYLVYAYGEEIGWRGYMFPKLLEQYEPSKALLIHNAIWAVWHIPILLALSPGKLEPTVDFLGTFVHASLFAYFYYKGGLAVSILYHALWNGFRDILITAGGISEIYISAAVVLFVGLYLTLTPQIWLGGENFASS
ncbi:hypothetical protein PAP_06595 [Palaeococcus pacificus DY20341]|uniref:CAAX prenyl protease 2/Lysostaphin resistance protein A-like domain-containing protein n=1 Tax=Palaeococcus pacificus DY20341 TaxID=1343739 RepID=A0A075LUA5_9EURY|nr:CPBP family intramembrane glutamic endopeptidase [Palaeococcus pacificus]AIF69716.1 hypothetical protein PAP_06595 [Palaeococcus pacificus DY20341]